MQSYDTRGSNGWAEYQKLVLSELERLNDWAKEFDNKLNEMKIDIATLKVKAAMWGGVAAMIAGPIVSIIVSKLIIK